METKMKQKRNGFKENTWMSRPCDSLFSNASDPPSSIQTQAMLSQACPSSSSVPSSSEVSSNKQRVAHNKDHKGSCCPNMFTQEMEFIYIGRVSLPGGLHLAPLLFPSQTLPLPSLPSPAVSITSEPAVYPMKKRNC